MDRSDVDALLFEYEHGHEMAKGTLRNYPKALRKSFRYHGREWAGDVEIGAVPGREVDADEALSEDESGSPRTRTSPETRSTTPRLPEDRHHPVDPPGVQRAGDRAPRDLGQGLAPEPPDQNGSS